MGFTNAQWQSLSIAPHFTSALSMVGDAWIVVDILWRRKKVKKLPLTSYYRILMCMSIWDFIVIGLGKFPASWAMPVGTPNIYRAAGNRQTCTMQGFFIQFSLIVPIYNAMIALYYLLVVHFGKSNRDIRNHEKWMHIGPFLVAMSFAVVGLMPSKLLYSTSTMWCWMNAEPNGCIQSYEGKGPTTCVRGDNAYIYRLAFYYCPIWLCIAFSAVSMIVIANGVRTAERKSRRYSIQQMNLDGARRRKRNTKTKDVATQACFYIGGFLAVWIVPTTNRVLAFFGIKVYVLTLLHAIFSPLQGFVNFLVYMRPRLIQHIGQQEKRSTLRASAGYFLFLGSGAQANQNIDASNVRNVHESLQANLIRREEEATATNRDEFVENDALDDEVAEEYGA